MFFRNNMFTKVITPDQKIFEGEVSSAKFPGMLGGFEVLENHAPMISTLKTGAMILKTKSEGEKSFTIDGGVVEILDNKLTVLVEAVA